MTTIQRKDFSSSWLAPCVLLFVLFAGTGFSQITWQKTYGGAAWDKGFCVDQTADGGYIVVGFTDSFGNGNQIYLIKTDSLGDTIWTRTYGGTGDDRGMCVQQTTDGGYIIAGYASSFGDSFQIYLIKTDSLGDTLWTKTYGGAADEYGYSVQQTQNGGFIIAGSAVHFSLYDPIYLIRTDSLGDTIWAKSYTVGQGHSVRQTQDGGYIVVGYDGWQICLVKTNSTGDTIWTRKLGGIETLDYGYSVQQTHDGGYIIAGASNEPYPEFSQVYLVKTDTLGDTIWTRKYGCEGHNSWGLSVQQTTDSGYIVVGSTSAFALGVVYLIKTNSSGDSIWSKIHGATTYRSCGYSVQQTTDGGYIIAGCTDLDPSGNNTQVYLIKTDQYGNSDIEENSFVRHPSRIAHPIASPNPFSSFTTVVGYEKERFILYDISGRQVGSYYGDRIGFGLPAGVYFLMPEDKSLKPVRIVKVR